MAHLLVSATHKSSGKTTLTLGLCAALRERGLKVQPFKKGPDYIDPLWLGGAAGRPCYNLDFNTQSREEITDSFGRRMQGVDLGVIEGNLGLFDGMDPEGSNSNAALAALLQAPVVLVVDAEGMTRGVAPLLQGYERFDPAVRIAGVILNNVAGRRHELRLREVMARYSRLPLLGVVHRDPQLRIVERHLGLIPSNEAEEAEATIARIRELVAARVDLEGVLELAGTAPTVAAPPEPVRPAPGEAVRIGVARDAAFGFYYPDDLEVIEACGGQLVPFDTLSDRHLPQVDGLFLGGGFPESRMEALEANESLRSEIRDFIESDGPAYAECGGLMYLSRSLTWGDKRCKMVGIIQGDAVMYERPQGRGYVRLRETRDFPWPAGGDRAGREVAAHEFHYSRLEGVEGSPAYAYEVLRGTGVDGSHDGIVYRNLLASYCHMRNVGDNRWAERFVAWVRAHRG